MIVSDHKSHTFSGYFEEILDKNHASKIHTAAERNSKARKLLQEQQCLFASVFVLFKRLKRGYISQKSGHSAH
jgi:hypothetical protein